MSTLHGHPLSTSLIAGLLALAAGGAHASNDLTIVMGTCSPGSAAALEQDLKLTNGAVRKSGRNPPVLYFCPVIPDDLTTKPSWNRLELQYGDLNAATTGNITARLMRKSLVNGAAVAIATAQSQSPTAFATAQAPLAAPMDHARYAYYVIVEMKTATKLLDAHTVRLVTR